MLRFILPLPPSANNLFPGKTRRYKSQEYKAWQQEAGLRMRCQVRWETFAVPVSLYYFVRGTINQQRDIGNLEKPLTDLLVACGVLAGDSLKYVHKIILDYQPDRGDGCVEVAVDPCNVGAGAVL